MGPETGRYDQGVSSAAIWAGRLSTGDHRFFVRSGHIAPTGGTHRGDQDRSDRPERRSGTNAIILSEEKIETSKPKGLSVTKNQKWGIGLIVVCIMSVFWLQHLKSLPHPVSGGVNDAKPALTWETIAGFLAGGSGIAAVANFLKTNQGSIDQIKDTVTHFLPGTKTVVSANQPEFVLSAITLANATTPDDPTRWRYVNAQMSRMGIILKDVKSDSIAAAFNQLAVALANAQFPITKV